METTFQLNLDDWKAFNRAVGGRTIWRYLAIPLVLGVVALQTLTDRRFMGNLRLMQLRYHFGGWHAVSAQVLSLVLPIVLVSAFWLVISIWNRRNQAKLPMFAQPITIRADDEGISGTSTQGRDTIFWRAVHQILETPTHFFILSAPQAGLIVPKRAFVSEAEATRFFDYVKAQWEQTRPQTPPLAQP